MSFGIQGTTDATSLLLQQQPQSGSGMRQFANLNLTEQQRTQIRSIFQNAKAQGLTRSQVQDQIKAILTPAQQATMAAGAQTAAGSQSASDPFANLNLSAQQQTQVAQILQTAKASGQTWSQDAIPDQRRPHARAAADLRVGRTDGTERAFGTPSSPP